MSSRTIRNLYAAVLSLMFQVYDRFTEKINNVSDLHNVYAKEVTFNCYTFDRLKRYADAVLSITKEQMIDFYNQYVNPDSPSVQYAVYLINGFSRGKEVLPEGMLQALLSIRRFKYRLRWRHPFFPITERCLSPRIQVRLILLWKLCFQALKFLFVYWSYAFILKPCLVLSFLTASLTAKHERSA